MIAWIPLTLVALYEPWPRSLRVLGESVQRAFGPALGAAFRPTPGEAHTARDVTVPANRSVTRRSS